MNSRDPHFDPNRLPAKGFQVPDLAEAVEGWRVWKVALELPAYGTGPKLYSVSEADYYWTPRRHSQATCSREHSQDVIPLESCSCGFYSTKTYDQLKGQDYYKFDGRVDVKVLGRVANWGKVIEGTQGWRAEKCYPVRLYVPFQAQHLAKPLANTYGVPVQVMNFLRKQTRPQTGGN